MNWRPTNRQEFTSHFIYGQDKIKVKVQGAKGKVAFSQF